MTFPEGQNAGGQPKVKEFRQALRKALFSCADADVNKAKEPRKIDIIAQNLVNQAMKEENPVAAIKEIADRIDGKVPQAVVGGDEDDPAIKVEMSDMEAAKRIAFLLAKVTSEQEAG